MNKKQTPEGESDFKDGNQEEQKEAPDTTGKQTKRRIIHWLASNSKERI